MSSQRFAWAVIYLNLPLWVAVIILAFVFGEWTTVRILVGANVVLLLTSYIWLTWPKGGDMKEKGKPVNMRQQGL